MVECFELMVHISYTENVFCARILKLLTTTGLKARVQFKMQHQLEFFLKWTEVTTIVIKQ